MKPVKCCREENGFGLWATCIHIRIHSHPFKDIMADSVPQINVISFPISTRISPFIPFHVPPIVSFPPLKNLQLLFLHLCTQLFPAFHPFLAFFHCKIRSLGEKNGRVLHINLHFFQRKFAILICLIYCEKSQTNPVFRTLYKNTTFHQFSLYFLVIFLSFLLRLIP